MNILYLVSDGILEYNSSHFRVSLQADALSKSGLANTTILNIRKWLSRSPEVMLACAKADIIVLQRVLLAESIDMAVYWIQRGKKVLVDFDDAYDLIGPENAAYPFWGRGEVEITTASGVKYRKETDVHPVDEFRRGLQLISGAITPSVQLGKDWSKYTRTYRIENYLDSKRYHRELLNERNLETITIGWGGSLSHLTSFSHSGVQDALAKLLKEYENVELLIVGDKRVISQLPFKNRVKFLPYVMWHDWPKMLKLYDIGIAPLAGLYDARRSGLKVREYICMGIPFVATAGMPYKDLEMCNSGIFVEQGSPDILDKPNPDAWYAGLKDIVGDYQSKYTIARNNTKKYHSIYDAEANAQNIYDVYQRILEN